MVVPGFEIVMTPPMEQLHMLPLWRAGMPRTVTVVEPSVHGVVAGTQGVGTPAAAAVRILQLPKGMIFTMGTKSWMLATGFISPVTFGATTVRADGAAPATHVRSAPWVTS